MLVSVNTGRGHSYFSVPTTDEKFARSLAYGAVYGKPTCKEEEVDEKTIFEFTEIITVKEININIFIPKSTPPQASVFWQ